MHYLERLLQLSTSQPDSDSPPVLEIGMDARTLGLVRLAALVAIGGEDASYGTQVDEAIGAGASPCEIVDVLAGVRPVVGQPRVVAAAPRVATALGADPDALDWGTPG